VEQFEYVMVLVSIIVALAITHLLMAIAETIHRIRGLGEPIKLDIVYALWIGYVFIWLVSFWWWEFKFQETAVEWSLGLYFFIVAYAALLFLLATILVPHRMRGVSNGYDHFYARTEVVLWRSDTDRSNRHSRFVFEGRRL